jgi:hypothetical protein
MLDQLPNRAFFRFELPIHYLGKEPAINGDVGKWKDQYRVPALCELDWDEPFADVYWAWNDDGFFAAFDVFNRTRLPTVDAAGWWKKDGLRLCIDTRDARDVKRATRFCHFFYILPSGGGPKMDLPIVGSHRMSRAKEPPPAIDTSLIQIATRTTRQRYSVELAIPARCLHGWDPAEHPRIGIFYKVRDTQNGAQTLSATDEMGWNTDPSTWATGVLVR